MEYKKAVNAMINCWKEVVELLMKMYGNDRREIAILLADEFTDMVWDICDELDFADEEVEAYEEPCDECGFNPYMGCYDYDC